METIPSCRCRCSQAGTAAAALPHALHPVVADLQRYPDLPDLGGVVHVDADRELMTSHDGGRRLRPLSERHPPVMTQPSSGDVQGPSAPVAAEADAGGPGERTKRDPKTLSLTGAATLTILASVVTLFVDKLALPLYASLMLGLLGIGLGGAALLMQTVPAQRRRPAGAVAVGVAVLMALTFFLTPHAKPASEPAGPTLAPSTATLQLRPDHGRINTSFVVAGTGCPQRTL